MPRTRRVRALRPTEQLRNFLIAAAELEASEFVQQGMPTKLNLSWNQEGVRVAAEAPTKPLLAECFIIARQFAANEGDPVFLDTIFNLCERHITDPVLREHARSIRQSWANVKRGAMRLRISDGPEDPGRAVAPTAIAGLWEGHLFHGDPEDRAALASLDPLSKALFETMFHHFLTGVVEVVLYTASFLAHVLDKGLVSDTPVPGAGI